ncbi:unnamed protein product [Cunninghamella echinulata]
MIKLPWELWNQYSDAMVKSANNQDEESDNDEELEAYKDSIQRLKEADDITKAMTREEYVHYSECRQASFTYRKNKRYREWASISSLVEMKPNDDIVDCLGFLTYEIISKLTTLALKIKTDIMEAEGKKEEENMSLVSGIKRKRKEDEKVEEEKKFRLQYGKNKENEDQQNEEKEKEKEKDKMDIITIENKDDNKNSQDVSTSISSPSIVATDFVTANTENNIKNNDNNTNDIKDSSNNNNDKSINHSTTTSTSSSSQDTPNDNNNIKNKNKSKEEEEGTGLFSLPLTEQTPLLPEHIYEAFRRLQQLQQPMKNFRGGLVRTKNILIL